MKNYSELCRFPWHKSVEDTKIYYTRSHYQKHQPHAVCVFRNPRLLMGASVALSPKYLRDTHCTQ